MDMLPSMQEFNTDAMLCQSIPSILLDKYSLWGSNPRPMAHKTIALTTELREHLLCMCGFLIAFIKDGHSVQEGCLSYSRIAILFERGARPILGRPFNLRGMPALY